MVTKPVEKNLSCRRNFASGWIAEHIATAPHCFNVMLAICRCRQFLAQFADEHVDDFQFRLIHAAVKVVEEHFLGSVVPLRKESSSSI